MSLEKLTLKHFQKWEILQLDLDPLITVLTGATESGKSAALRALTWLATNKPSGDSFIKVGADKCSAKLTIDGKTITRKRGKGTNTYSLNKEVYKSFGQEVPTDIAGLLNLDSKLNLQGQHDAPYWLSLSPGEVSRELNSVMNLSLMDETLSRVSSQERRARDAVSISEERLGAAQQRVKELEWIEECNQALQEIEQLQEELDTCKANQKSLHRQLSRLEEVQKESNLEIPDISPVEALWDEWRELVANRNALDYLIANIGGVQACLKETNQELEKSQSSYLQMMGKVCPLCGSQFPF